MPDVREAILDLEKRVGTAIVGQEDVVRRLILGLLADGHLLLEGLPGLAKTRAVKTLARELVADMRRIQFTPDLLPSDVTGTEVYHQDGGKSEFRFEPGPIFANLVLADEINRAPAKVQSALLEAMEERQVTVAGKSHKVPDLFLVLATQNPIEQEGTYALPEAQLDRFLMHVRVDYPSGADELAILRLVRSEEGAADAKGERTPQEVVMEARKAVRAVKVAEAVEKYMVDLVVATREPDRYAPLKGKIALGGSPRATIGLDRCARARAWLEGRTAVTPDDVRDVAPSVLRHRVRPTYDALAAGLTSDGLVRAILEQVAVG